MKKHTVCATAATLLAMVLGPLTLVQATSAGASVARRAQQNQAITIESWLYLVPSENVMSGTVWDCFKISGAINDEGGGPTWTGDASYHAPNLMTSGGVTSASRECANKEPAGAVVLVPPPEAGQYQFATYTSASGSPGGLSTFYAVHTLIAQKGDIYISFAGTYNMTNNVVPVKQTTGATVDVQPLTTGPQCTWLITGGTGAYAGLEGSGTCFGTAQNTVPWFNHTEQGTVWSATNSH
jgi:hypothetical protein